MPKPGLPEINRMAVYSTAHITKETSEFLDGASDDPDCQLWTMSSCYGYIIWVPDAIDEYEAPAELKRVLAHARRVNCQWARLDCDASIVEGLPTFDW